MHHRPPRATTGRAAAAVLAAATALSLLTLAGPGELSATSAVAAPAGALTPTPAPTEPTDPPVTPVPPDGRPNIVLILTDDQRDNTFSTMPNVRSLLKAKGTTYTNAMVPTSLCCPSRSTILTGLYAHTSRLFGNGDVGGRRYGGWARFHQLGLEQRTMATALQAAGYRTGLVGKYLNFFGRDAAPGYVPPGWDTFVATLADHGAYYDYQLSDGTSYGHEPQDYSTDVFAARATQFIATTPPTQPLFLYFAPFGPHAPYKPAPRDLGTLDGKLATYTAATLHQPLRTMPRWMRLRHHYGQAAVSKTRQRQLEALMSVDDAVGSIVSTLQATGRERDTLFVFMSDNGYFWGEHRIIGKDAPYKMATDIPMVLRWDGHVAAGVKSPKMVLNVDVARTIATAAGAQMTTDGLNILGTYKRTGFPLEAMNGYNDRPAYCGWRSPHRMYVRWATGEEELYDYRADPRETTNLAADARWSAVRNRWQQAAESACRPMPPGFSW